MSPYLTADDAIAYLKLPTVAALHAMLYRRRKAGRPITTYRLNGRLRFKAADLEAALTREQAPRSLRKAG